MYLVRVISTALAITCIFYFLNLINFIATSKRVRLRTQFVTLIFRQSTNICWVAFFWLLLSLVFVAKKLLREILSPDIWECIFSEGFILKVSAIVLSENSGLVISKNSGLVVLKGSDLVNRSDNTFLNISIPWLLLIVNLLIFIAWLFHLAFLQALFSLLVCFFLASTAFLYRPLFSILVFYV